MLQQLKALLFLGIIALTGCAGYGTIVTDPDERRSEHIEEHRQSQEVAFDRLMRWAAQTYNSAQDVVQYENREAGSVVLKGVHYVTRAGVRVPLQYTATIDVRDRRVRFRYDIGGPPPTARPGTAGPIPHDIGQMKEFFDSLTYSAMGAIETRDTF